MGDKDEAMAIGLWDIFNRDKNNTISHSPDFVACHGSCSVLCILDSPPCFPSAQFMTGYTSYLAGRVVKLGQ